MATFASTATVARPFGLADLASVVAAGARATPWPRHILVASSGAPSSESALAAARALARRSGASVEMLAVFAPRIPAPPDADRADGAFESSDRTQVAQLLRAVRAQRDAVVRSGPVWPLRFESGDPPRVIARIAREKAVDLLVVGIGRTAPRERQCGNVTPALTANETDVPLLAAAPGSESPSRRTIVLLPERHVHLPTIETAIGCTADGGDVWIALPAPNGQRHDAESDNGPVVELSVGESTPVRVGSVTLHAIELGGEPLAAVLALAAGLDAGIVAVPVCGDAGSVRSLLPNFAGPLLLTASCSVLVVPDPVDGGEASC